MGHDVDWKGSCPNRMLKDLDPIVYHWYYRTNPVIITIGPEVCFIYKGVSENCWRFSEISSDSAA